MSVVVRLAGVTKRYHRGREVVTAVDDVSLELSAGSMTALVGPSGSGKTTLLNLTVGGDEPDEGTITGLPPRPGWTDVSIVPQTLGLLQELTMGENVGLPLRLGAAGARTVSDVMESLGLGSVVDRPPEETSLGEQQRAAVARALVTETTLLVADEPTSHQDEINMRLVTDALADMAAGGSSVFLATHDPRVLDRCDRIVYIRDGVVTFA